MRDLRQQNIATVRGVRIPASLRAEPNTVTTVVHHVATESAKSAANAAGESWPANSVGHPEVSSLTLLILSWMHRRNADAPQAWGGSKAR